MKSYRQPNQDQNAQGVVEILHELIELSEDLRVSRDADGNLLIRDLETGKQYQLQLWEIVH